MLMVCVRCKREVVVATWAGNGETVVLEPDAHGDVMELVSGEDEGKFIRLRGPVLARSQVEIPEKLYRVHPDECPYA